MPRVLHSFVDFHGDFPCSEWPPHDPETIPGKELAEYLTAQLRAREFNVAGPEAIDYEHLIAWQPTSCRFELGVGTDDLCELDRWIIQAVPRPQRGFFKRSVNQTDLDEFAKLLEALDEILKESPRIRDVRWFPGFDTPDIRNRHVAYDGPMSDRPVYQPELTRLDRAMNWHDRLCDSVGAWIVPAVIAGIFLGVPLFMLGYPTAAKIGFVLPGLTFATISVAWGTGMWLWGVDMFQDRLRRKAPVSAWLGLVLYLLGGAFLVWLGIVSVWAMMDAWWFM